MLTNRIVSKFVARASHQSHIQTDNPFQNLHPRKFCAVFTAITDIVKELNLTGSNSACAFLVSFLLASTSMAFAQAIPPSSPPAQATEENVETPEQKAEDAEQMINARLAKKREELQQCDAKKLPEICAGLHYDIGMLHRALIVKDAPVQLAAAETEFREALALYTKAKNPQQWAFSNLRLAETLEKQASSMPGDKRALALQEAVDCYQATLTVWTRLSALEEWLLAKNNLGAALHHLASVKPYKEALTEHREAVRILREVVSDPKVLMLPDHGVSALINMADELNLAHAQENTPETFIGLVDAERILRTALKLLSPKKTPPIWVSAQEELVETLVARGLKSKDMKDFASADEAMRAALLAYRPGGVDWARLQIKHGFLYAHIATQVNDARKAALFNKAAEVLRTARTDELRKRSLYDWAQAQGKLGNVLLFIYNETPDKTDASSLREAIEAQKAALTVYDKEQRPDDWGIVHYNLAFVQILLADRTSGAERESLLTEAIESCQAALSVNDKNLPPLVKKQAQDSLEEAQRKLREGKGDSLPKENGN